MNESCLTYSLCLFSQAAGEEGGDREHDGHHLQRSFSEEISVSASLILFQHGCQCALESYLT